MDGQKWRENIEIIYISKMNKSLVSFQKVSLFGELALLVVEKEVMRKL